MKWHHWIFKSKEMDSSQDNRSCHHLCNIIVAETVSSNNNSRGSKIWAITLSLDLSIITVVEKSFLTEYVKITFLGCQRSPKIFVGSSFKSFLRLIISSQNVSEFWFNIRAFFHTRTVSKIIYLEILQNYRTYQRLVYICLQCRQIAQRCAFEN